MGLTQGVYGNDEFFLPFETGLVVLSHVEAIEAEDFANNLSNRAIEEVAGQAEPEIGSAEWRRKNAQRAANARYDQPGGSREKRRQIREIWTSGLYSSRNICAASVGQATAVDADVSCPKCLQRGHLGVGLFGGHGERLQLLVIDVCNNQTPPREGVEVKEGSEKERYIAYRQYIDYNRSYESKARAKG